MAVAPLMLIVGFTAALKAVPGLPQHGADWSVSRLPMSTDPLPMTPLEITDHVVNLKRRQSRSMSSYFVQTLREQARAIQDGGDSRLSNGSANLVSVEAGQVFLAPIIIGGQNFEVVVDTGSSDPWLVTSEFTCINPATGEEEPESFCAFGHPYHLTRSSTYTAIPDENFNITYSDSELMNGAMAYESFTLGGITVPQQEFGVVDKAAWYGDHYSSGLVGFAYATLTSAFYGTDPSQDTKGNTTLYNPLFVSMYNLSLIAPVFSLAIDRDPNNGGVLALGGIPDIPHSPYWASSPIQSVGVFSGTDIPAYEFYTVQSDGFAISSSPYTQFNTQNTDNPSKTNVIDGGMVVIDSGTSLVYAPNAVADAVAAAFSPPATYNENVGTWYVSCNATAPIFGVSISQKIFFVNGEDLVVPSSDNECISGVQRNNGGLAILGDVWMKNVISVFDIGAEMMRFSAREYYNLTETSQPADT